MPEGRAILDDFIEVSVGSSKLFFEPYDVSLDASGDDIEGNSPHTVFLCGKHPDDLPPASQDGSEVLGFLVGEDPASRSYGLSEK